MPQQQDWFAANAQQRPTQPAAPAGDWFAQNAQPATFRADNEKDATGNAVVRSHAADFVGEVGHALNPIEMAKSLYGVATNLHGTVKGMGEAQGRLYQDAEAAFQSGDYLTATRKFANYLMPILGPIVDRSSDLFAEGKYGAGTGAMVGLGLQSAIPAAVSRVASVRPRLLPQNPTPAVRDAVTFGAREGIPIDAATATGNPVVRGAQWGAERTAGGSMVAGRARQGQADALAATGERIAGRVHPSAVTAEQAGQGVRDAVSRRAAGYDTTADTSYSRLRAFEQQQATTIAQTGGIRGPATSARPFTNQPLAVDIAPTKAALRPTYDALVQENKVVPFISGSQKGKALVMLERIMAGPDTVPLSVADGALSEIKAMARVDDAFRRTAGQGVAAQAVTNLDRSVVAAARQGGPDVFRSLMDGRAATVNKYKTIDILDTLRTEPVQVFTQLTAGKDSAITLLRDVVRTAPQELPKVGRAYLEGLLQKATAEGGFSRTQGLMADWQRLGPEAKRLLFGPARVTDLDNFFLLAKRMSENPNPSGTAFQVGIGAQGALLFTNPGLGAGVQLAGAALTKVLTSPRAVRVLMRGMRIPLGDRAAATAAAAELSKIVRESAVPLVPAVAEESEESTRAPR